MTFREFAAKRLVEWSWTQNLICGVHQAQSITVNFINIRSILYKTIVFFEGGKPAATWRHASATSSGPNGLSTISTSGVRLDPESVEKFARRNPDPLDFLGLGPPSPRCYTRRPATVGRPVSVETGKFQTKDFKV